LINEKLIDARIQTHGPPPAEGQEQRKWYQDVLRESLKVAAKTRLIVPANTEKSSTHSTQRISFPQDAKTGIETPHGDNYNLADMRPDSELEPQQIVPIGHSAQELAISHRVQSHNHGDSVTVIPFPSTHFMDNQRHLPQVANYDNRGSNLLSSSSHVMTGNMANHGWYQNVPRGIDQILAQQYYAQSDLSSFEAPESGSLPPSEYPHHWSMHDGRNG
jgi:hypothetical protein